MSSFLPAPVAALNPWSQILAALEKKLGRQSFDTWLKPTRYDHVDGRTLVVRVPAAEFEHIGERYGDLIQEAIELLGLEFDDVTFTPPPEPPVRNVRHDGGFAPQSHHQQNGRLGQPSPAPIAGPSQGRLDWNT